ncbi:MAG: type I-C CRISPR-associated endonuclease Cas1c [Thermoplasmata archaeon]|nr:type I-C CRISPR-associated endonuclease Cas1c [Thermoplasmata archaeon]
MRQLLNTLYVTSPDSYVRRDGTNIVVDVAGKEAGRVPIHNIQQVVCFGNSGGSPSAMRLCAENGVTMTFMRPNGRFLASVNGETRGNVLLRREQYRIADDPRRALAISSNMVRGKIVNCRAVLRKGMSNHPDRVDADAMAVAIGRLSDSISQAASAESASELRGIEGDAAKVYFGALNSLILQNRAAFFMHERTRRPPRDRFNALLSFLYSMLTNDVRSALEASGLDPYVGFLHTDRPGRPSLALDVMEEMRPVADRLALRLVNLRLLDPEGFIVEEGGAVRMDDDTRATVIREWQGMKSATAEHPFLGESIQTGMVPFAQAMLLAKCVRGDIDGYPPFVLRRRSSDGPGDVRRPNRRRGRPPQAEARR